MYNFNNLEEMLRNGMSADEIAQAFTKNLNAAIDAAKPTPIQEAGEELAKAWNHMIDLWLEDNDIPSYLDSEDDLYISGDVALHLFKESMHLLSKIAPLWDAIADFVNDEAKPATKPAPVLKNTDNEIDEFDRVMRSFLNSIK